MIFISETEDDLELMHWQGIKDWRALFKAIAANTKSPVTALIEIHPEDFLKSIQQSADPGDEIMVKYAIDYTHLFHILSSSLTNLKVIKAGTIHQHIFIAGFSETEGCIALHTTATET